MVSIDFLIELRARAHQTALVVPGYLEQQGINLTHVVFHVVVSQIRDGAELFTLADGIVDGHSGVFFVCGNVGGDLHPLFEQLYQLAVDAVDLVAMGEELGVIHSGDPFVL